MAEKEKDETAVEETEQTPIDPISFMTKLVEQNKEDEDFIVNASQVVEGLKGTKAKELEIENERLKAELTKSKKRFYDTFMGKVSTEQEHEIVEEQEEKRVTLDEMLQKLER